MRRPSRRRLRPAWREPRPTTVLDVLRTVTALLLAVATAILAITFIPLYGMFAGETGPASAGDGRGGVGRTGLGRVWPAAVVAYLGLVLAAVVAGGNILERIRYERPVGWVPVVAVPVILAAWLLGLLVALLIVN